MKITKKMKKVVLASVLAIFGATALVGCSGPSPKDTVSSYFSEISKGKSADISSFITKQIQEQSSDEAGQSNQEFFTTETGKALEEQIKKIKCEVISEKIDGDKATVNVKIIGPNIASAFVNMVPKLTQQALTFAFSENAKDEKAQEEEFNKLAEGILIEELKVTKSDERTGNISLVKKDNEWTIETNEEFTKLITGTAQM